MQPSNSITKNTYKLNDHVKSSVGSTISKKAGDSFEISENSNSTSQSKPEKQLLHKLKVQIPNKFLE